MNNTIKNVIKVLVCTIIYLIFVFSVVAISLYYCEMLTISNLLHYGFLYGSIATLVIGLTLLTARVIIWLLDE